MSLCCALSFQSSFLIEVAEVGNWIFCYTDSFAFSLGPNPTRRYSVTQNASTSGKSEEKKSRKPPASGFGSNIHTLKRDEDDERFSDRNSFWNGNSTEYGGNDDGK